MIDVGQVLIVLIMIGAGEAEGEEGEPQQNCHVTDFLDLLGTRFVF